MNRHIPAGGGGGVLRFFYLYEDVPLFASLSWVYNLLASVLNRSESVLNRVWYHEPRDVNLD